MGMEETYQLTSALKFLPFGKQVTLLAPDPLLPNDTKLCATLTTASGGLWGECGYDIEAVI
jgi:hypothetical protein